MKPSWLALINIVIHSLALACTFYMGVLLFFAARPGELAIPATVLFLCCFWQPWFIVLCLVPLNYFPLVVPVGFVLSNVITYFVYKSMYQRGKLDWLVRLGPRAITSCIVGLIFLSSIVSYATYKDVLFASREIPFLNFEKNIAASYPFTDSRTYTLSPFWPRQFLWRVHLPREQMPSLAQDLNMNKVLPGTLSASFWQQPPYWWRRPTGTVDEYTAGYFSVESASAHGWAAGAAYDPQSETLYILGHSDP